VPIISQEIYHSANGDHWHLIDDGRSNQIFVRHEANLPSGGCVTDTNIADFLNVNGSGPEYAALQDIIRQGLAGSIRQSQENRREAFETGRQRRYTRGLLMNDLHADSLDVVEIVMSLEDAFGLEIPEKSDETIR
jgi:hypothetical protein